MQIVKRQHGGGVVLYSGVVKVNQKGETNTFDRLVRYRKHISWYCFE